MKAPFILVAGMAGLTIAAQAQKLPASKIPAAVKTAFAKTHPEIKAITWEKEKANYEAGFKWKGQETSEIYTPAGVLVESETEIKPAELPAAVTTYISAHYKGAQVKEAAKITKVNGNISYEAEINGKDVLFDAKGNPIK